MPRGFDQHEFFESIEIGYTSGAGMIYLDNVHVTLWHQDERIEADRLDTVEKLDAFFAECGS